MHETKLQRLNRISKIEIIATAHGWSKVTDSCYQAPSGTVHDLSAADLQQLDRIEKEGLFKENLAELLDPFAWSR